MHAKSSQLSSLAGRLAAYKKVDTGCMHAATASSQPARIPVFRTRLVRRSDVDGWADGAASNSASRLNYSGKVASPLSRLSRLGPRTYLTAAAQLGWPRAARDT
jgi:hypothetical protein